MAGKAPYARVREGDLAPDFTLPSDTGDPVTLSALRGQRVVLYFYQKDDTTGCTIEACEFRDLLPRIKARKAAVLGLSPDSLRKHARFRAKHGLTFPLLSDPDAAVCRRYGVWHEKLFWGRRYMGVMRTTYVIDPTGRVERLWEHVDHAGHAEEVRRHLADAGAPGPPRSGPNGPARGARGRAARRESR